MAHSKNEEPSLCQNRQQSYWRSLLHFGVFLCTDPFDIYNSKLKSFYGQLWHQMVKKCLQMADNLAPLQVCRWKNNLLRGVIANKYYFALVWRLNLYIFLTLNSSEIFQNYLFFSVLKKGTLATTKIEERKKYGFSNLISVINPIFFYRIFTFFVCFQDIVGHFIIR